LLSVVSTDLVEPAVGRDNLILLILKPPNQQQMRRRCRWIGKNERHCCCTW